MYGRYLKITSENLITENEDEQNRNITKNNEQKYKFLYNSLSKNYIEKNNITLNNISNFVEISNIPLEFTAIKIHAVEEERTRLYSVYGRIEKKTTGEFVKYAFFKVKFDIYNNTFSIEPIENVKDIGQIELAKDETPIEKNENNSYTYIKITEIELLNKYIDYYKDVFINYPEEAYNILDEAYKAKRFKNIEEFKSYLKPRIDIIKSIHLDSYKNKRHADIINYTCLDTKGNYFIIEQNGIMEIKVTPDIYSVDIPEFTDKYYAAEDRERMAWNVKKIVEAFNNKDYNYIYSKLANSFKNNYFKTEESFIEYASKNFYNKMEVKYLYNEKESEEYYSYTIQLIDEKTKEKKYLKIIMELLEGTDFIMSFSLE